MVVKFPHRGSSGGGFQPVTLDDASKAAAKSIVKFYGTSVPRPRFFSNAHGGSRVDPPLPVLDPLLSWANEAHWSMGGLSFHRLRLQGRIEGSVEKLRVQREKVLKSSPKGGNKRASSVSPPPAPMAVKRRRFLAPSDDEDEYEDEVEDDEADGEFKKAVEEEEEEMEMDTPVKPKTTTKKRLRKGAIRKLGDDFERVANESDHVQIAGKAMNVVDEVNLGFESKPNEGLRNGQKRTSARLAKRSPN